MRGYLVGQADAILDGHARALREILQGRVRGVAQQRHAPVDPVVHRIAIAQHPKLPIRAVADDVLRARVDVFEAAHHVALRAGLPGDWFGRVVVIRHDQVEHLPARQRVVHDVAFRPRPQRCGVPAQVCRHHLRRDHRAIRRMAGNAGRPIADHLFADVGPQPVGADQRRAAHPLAGGQAGGDGGVVLLVADDFATGAQLDAVAVAASLQEHAVQVAPMHHGVGIAEAPAERLVKRDMGDLLAAGRIHQTELVDEDSHGTGGLADAEGVEAVKRVGSELDAGADLAQRRRFLEHEDRDAFAGQAERCGQATDSAAGNDERQYARCRHGSSSLSRLARRGAAQLLRLGGKRRESQIARFPIAGDQNRWVRTFRRLPG